MAKKRRRLVRYERERLPLTVANVERLREVVELFARDPLEAVERWALARAVELVGESDAWRPPVELDPLTLKIHRFHWFSGQLSRLPTDDPEPVEDLAKLLNALAELSLARRDGSVRGAELAGYAIGRLVERMDVVRHIEHAAAVGIEVSEGSARGGTNKRLPDDEKDRRRREWGPVVEELRRKNPELNMRTVYHRAGLKLGVSGETVRRALKK